MFLHTITRKVNVVDYYKCYIDGFKSCPSPDLQHIAKLYEDLITPGSPLSAMGQSLNARLQAIMRRATEAKRQEL